MRAHLMFTKIASKVATAIANWLADEEVTAMVA
jgi:hypothetical protein